jgi:hypothetical protein
MADQHDKPKRTPAEQRIIDIVAASRGREFAEQNATLILDQARLVGELSDVRPDPLTQPDDYWEDALLRGVQRARKSE